jgi:endonuclease I
VKKQLLYFALLITFPIFSQIPAYYNGLDFTKSGNDLFLELSERITETHVAIPYTGYPIDVWEACKQADEDPNLATNLLLIYGYNDTDGISDTDRSRNKDLQDTGGGDSGKWNREHVFAKSLANPSLVTDEPGPGTDVHNLRPADAERNTLRSNRKFTDGSGNSTIVSSNGGWYPGDEWKGDIARIVMYMYTRYHGTGAQISETSCLPINVGFGTTLDVDQNMIELFLNWNVEDPVSDFEANRNEVLYGIQGNRNPYVDNPYLATLIWGGLIAEDRWDMNSNADTEAPTSPSNLISNNITDESFEISWDASTDNVGVYDYQIYLDGTYLQSTNTTSSTILNLSSNTNYIITIKARDAASNYSNFSNGFNVKTLEGPTYLFQEDFEDCANLNFFSYNEASNKNWTCQTQYGENNSGSIDINGFNQDVLSKDWLITSNPINFDNSDNEKLSFYTDAAYGNSPLVLVYSTDYDGSGSPTAFTWITVPNVNILIKSDTSGTEEVFTFSNIDVSSINGNVYFAFKYYANSSPTRWTVDSFEITADNNPDVDGDGVLNENDLCPNTPAGDSVDANGCSYGQLDDDNDGVQNSNDNCSDTPSGESVNANGCSQSQLDDDGDGVMNNVDLCPSTPANETVDVNGCAESQKDDDNDGVNNASDKCPSTTLGALVNDEGCFILPESNFKIETVSETCAGKKNGKLLITAVESLTYKVTINNTAYTFSNANTLEIDNLQPQTLTFCISVDGESYEQCYTVTIEAGLTVAGKVTVTANKAAIEITEGTAPFNILINGAEKFKTMNSSFTIDEVSHGDLVEVKTALDCEGVLTNKIELFDTIIAYPNPTDGYFEISLPIADNQVTVELYNAQMQLILAQTYPVNFGKVQLNIKDKPAGIYIAKINLDKPVVLKVVKN